MVVHDQLGTTLACHVAPNPFQEDAQAEARRRQELEVHERPCEPRPEATRLDLEAMQHSKTFTHDCHGSLIKVAKRTRRWVTCDAAMNQLSCIAPSLNCHLRNTWQRMAVLIER